MTFSIVSHPHPCMALLALFLAYCKRGEELFSQLAEVANAFKDLMSEFRTKLSQEEIVSQAAKLSHRK